MEVKKVDIIQGKNFRYDNTCITIGKFDGIHIGHRKILDTIIDISKKSGYISTVFTFDFSYFSHKSDERLNSREEKKKILLDYGIELLIDYPFDEEIKNKSPREFTEEILLEKLGMKAIVVGDNFRFGKNAMGNADTLKELGQEYGFEVVCIPLVEYEGSMVSSSRIRRELGAGHITEAYNMLNPKLHVNVTSKTPSAFPQ